MATSAYMGYLHLVVATAQMLPLWCGNSRLQKVPSPVLYAGAPGHITEIWPRFQVLFEEGTSVGPSKASTKQFYEYYIGIVEVSVPGSYTVYTIVPVKEART
jgi:hypothetical protein